MVKVRIPSPLQKLTDNQVEVELEGKNVKEILEKLVETYPSLKDRIYDENGKLRRFINVFVNEEDIRFLQGEETPLKEGDTISLIPAIAGGENA